MIAFACVEAGSVGVVQTCGDFQGVKEPGCSPYCCPFQTITPVSLAVQQIECRSDCKTKDNVTLSVVTAVQYRISKESVKVAIFDIANPRAQMNSYVDSVLRSTLPTLDLDEAYAAQEKMVGNILESVRGSMLPFGYDVLNVLITDLRPEASVLKAMNDINASKRQREAALQKGEADKILKLKASEADAESKHLAGIGMAKMRTALAQGFKESIQMMEEGGLKPPEAMHMMMMTQYIDTMKEFANNSHASIMVPSGPGAVKDLEAQIRDGFLTSKALSETLVPKKNV